MLKYGEKNYEEDVAIITVLIAICGYYGYSDKKFCNCNIYVYLNSHADKYSIDIYGKQCYVSSKSL